jgi:hypothetical protein
MEDSQKKYRILDQIEKHYDEEVQGYIWTKSLILHPLSGVIVMRILPEQELPKRIVQLNVT